MKIVRKTILNEARFRQVTAAKTKDNNTLSYTYIKKVFKKIKKSCNYLEVGNRTQYRWIENVLTTAPCD